MSTLTGHSSITLAAVRSLKHEWEHHPMVRRLSPGGIRDHVIGRDIVEVIAAGHWLDYGQKHHFMRTFDGRSEYDCYHDGSLDPMSDLRPG